MNSAAPTHAHPGAAAWWIIRGMTQAPSRAMTNLQDKLERARAALAASREKLREGGKIAIESGEVAAGAAVAGFIRGRAPEYGDLGPGKTIPIEAVLFVGAQALAQNDAQAAEHYRAVGNGALAFYVGRQAEKWGADMRARASGAAPPAPR